MVTMGVKSVKAATHILMAMLVLHFRCSNQESLYDDDGNFHKHSTKSLPCFERYVMESFFREYYNVADPKFPEYMEHKILVGSEATFSRLMDLERRLIGEGSHRRLSSSIKVSIQPHRIADFSSHICEVILIERLPCGVFADPFELQHLLHRGVFNDASVFGDTNLELPSFLSNQSIVEIHLDASLNNSAGKQIVLEFKMEIPLHARYPPLEESGYTEVRFGAPDLFIRCKMHGNSPARSCSMSRITSSGSLELDDTIWSIPAGVKAHSRTVSIVTFTSALLSAYLIIIASLRSSHMESNGRLKKS